MIFILASLLLILNVYAGRLDKLFQVHSLGPPRWVVLVVATGWVLILGLIHHRGATPSRIAFGLAWLVVGTRAFALLIFPFHRLPGDMLDAINRSLDLLLAGRFPYVNFPPPMPYLPGTFLAYLPAKLLGLDLRVTNLVLEGATAWMAVRLLSGQDWKSGAVVRRVPMESVLLPFLMLHPTWSHLGANCQFAPTVLTTLLLSRALTSASPLWQGAALGLAVGTNQMIGALAPLAFIYWARRFGGRAAAGATIAAATVLLVLVAPFLIWNAQGFVEIAFQPRPYFGRDWMAGRLTLLPLAETLFPHPTAVLSVLAVGLGSLFAARSRSGEQLLSAMAVTLCVAILALSVTFPHYFLPVMVLAAAAPRRMPDIASSDDATDGRREETRHQPGARLVDSSPSRPRRSRRPSDRNPIPTQLAAKN